MQGIWWENETPTSVPLWRGAAVRSGPRGERTVVALSDSRCSQDTERTAKPGRTGAENRGRQARLLWHVGGRKHTPSGHRSANWRSVLGPGLRSGGWLALSAVGARPREGAEGITRRGRSRNTLFAHIDCSHVYVSHLQEDRPGPWTHHHSR